MLCIMLNGISLALIVDVDLQEKASVLVIIIAEKELGWGCLVLKICTSKLLGKVNKIELSRNASDLSFHYSYQ